MFTTETRKLSAGFFLFVSVKAAENELIRSLIQQQRTLSRTKDKNSSCKIPFTAMRVSSEDE